jgi:hypothetical protein
VPVKNNKSNKKEQTDRLWSDFLFIIFLWFPYSRGIFNIVIFAQWRFVVEWTETVLIIRIVLLCKN